MTMSNPITQDPKQRLLTHKDHALEMMESIIKDKDVDPCAEQATIDLGALGLFYLTRVRSIVSLFIHSYA